MRDWFEVVPRPTGRFKKIVRRWDMAATDEKKVDFDPDWTVGLLIGEHEDGFIYVLDMVRVQEDPGKVSRTLKSTAQRDTRRVRIRMEREPGASGKIVISLLAKTIFRGYSFRGIPSSGNKMLRADSCAAAAERGEIKIVRGKWNSDFFYEVTRFPRAAHDDIVDAFSGGFWDLTSRGQGIQVW